MLLSVVWESIEAYALLANSNIFSAGSEVKELQPGHLQLAACPLAGQSQERVSMCPCVKTV